MRTNSEVKTKEISHEATVIHLKSSHVYYFAFARIAHQNNDENV